VARDCYQLLLKRRPLNTSLSSFQEEIHREFGFFCTLLGHLRYRNSAGNLSPDLNVIDGGLASARSVPPREFRRCLLGAERLARSRQMHLAMQCRDRQWRFLQGQTFNGCGITSMSSLSMQYKRAASEPSHISIVLKRCT
jgi:hypothetical protein